jgi:hypothetical protein
MPGIRIITAVLAVTSLIRIAAFAQPSPWGFSVLDGKGQPRMITALKQVPYKSGTEPSVDWNLRSTTALRDRNGQVISGIGFYGWTEGGNTRVAVIARLPPEGAENKFYGWGELSKIGLKPRLELIATYTLTSGDPATMQELKALGAEAAALRIEMQPPK